MQFLTENEQVVVVGVTHAEMLAIMNNANAIMKQEALMPTPRFPDPRQMQHWVLNKATDNVLGPEVSQRAGKRPVSIQVIPDDFVDVKKAVNGYTQAMRHEHKLADEEVAFIASAATSLMVSLLQQIQSTKRFTGGREIVMASAILATTLNVFESVRKIPVQRGGDLFDPESLQPPKE